MIFYKKLRNGLRLAVQKMPELRSVTMGIFVHTGSAIETDEEDGISHFIEHMLFKGTEKRTAYDISNDMDKIGAQSNAYTSKDTTCFYAKSTTAHAAEAFDVLADLFLNATFPEVEQKREKGVIIEEINMTEDTPDDLCMDLLCEAYYGKTGYGRNILGPKENIRRFTDRDAHAYMARRYTAGNIVIVMAGNIDEAEAEAMVRERFDSLPALETEPFEAPVATGTDTIFRNKKIEQSHIGITFPSVKQCDDELDAAIVLNMILGGGMSSRLFQSVREKKGLAYTVFSYLSPFVETGSISVYAGVASDKVDECVDAVFDCIDSMKKEITAGEFARAKEQVLASNIFAQESTSSQMSVIAKELIYFDRLYDFDEKIRRLEAVTRDDVCALMEKSFKKEEAAYALVGDVKKPIERR